jgi:predicted metal-dependent enzyme (double-stranded beta helix superfamily)
MNQTNVVSEEAKSFVDRLHAMKLSATPSDEQLQVVAAGLRELACSSAWDNCLFREASVGEELLHVLAVSADEGPSLYLVSDGTTVVSPPHDHETWVIIAGIRGHELNHRYVVRSTQTRSVSYGSAIDVGPGDTLVLQVGEVHSTEVMAAHATFHLHLYGRPLRSLRCLESRSYSVLIAG